MFTMRKGRREGKGGKRDRQIDRQTGQGSDPWPLGDGAAGGSGVQDGEHMYAHGGFKSV